MQQFFKTQLLPIATISYITGIYSASLFAQSTHFDSFLMFLFCITGILLIWSSLRFKVSAGILLVYFFIQAGYLTGTNSFSTPESANHIYNIIEEQQEAVVVGRIKRIYSFNGNVTRFDIYALSLKTISHNFRKTHGVIRYTIKGELPDFLVPGATAAIRAKLKHPQKYHTPGSFDYPAYLAQHNIFITGFIRSPSHLSSILTPPDFWQKLYYSPEIVRAKINRYIDACLDGDVAAIYKALLTGDRTAISTTALENFKGAGLLHILAISGLHMSLLGFILFTLIFWLLRRSEWLILRVNTKKIAALSCAVPLILYALIAGAKAPVLRALLMGLVVLIALCSERRHSFTTLAALSAFLILIISPAAAVTPSFQLTFAAVIAITAAVPYITALNALISHRLRYALAQKAAHWFAAGIIISLAATVGTAPLLVYHFNRISLVGIAANLVVEPVVCLWSLLIGFVAVLCTFMLPTAAESLFQLGALGLQLSLNMAAFFNSFDPASLYLPTLSTAHLCIYYVSLISIFIFKTKKPWCRITSITYGFALLLLFVSPVELTKSFTTFTKLTFLDVGQGSCALIEFPGGQRVLIDGGAISSPHFDIGERIIAPFLLHKGIQSIDQIIVTHKDSDHYNGIPHILRHFNVKTLWVNDTEILSEGWDNLLQTADEYSVAVQSPADDNIIHNVGASSLVVVANNSSENNRKSNNDNGLVLKYIDSNFSVLFPGDISAGKERQLLTAKKNVSANILLAAHHGSSTSNSLEFLRSVNPEYIIVSSGRNWKRSFPSPLLYERCVAQGISLFPISQTGTITISNKKGEYSVSTLLPL